MAAVTAPSRRSLLGHALESLPRPQWRARVAAAAARARQHVVTAAALTSVDIGCFHIGTAAGWVVTGFSLLALDFAVRG